MRLTIVWALALGLGSCRAPAPSSGGEAFSIHWRNDEGIPMPAIHSRIKDLSIPQAPSVAIGVGQRHVFGHDLTSQAAVWQVPLALVAEPAASGGIVVLSTESELIALDILTGERWWSLPRAGRDVFGIDDDGEVTAITLGPGPDDSPSVVVMDHSGSRRLQLESDSLLGSPAVRGPYVLVPWNNQFISFIDIAEQEEVGRLVLHRQTSQAIGTDGQLYFGETELLHFDEAVASHGPGKGTWISPKSKQLPGDPVWFQRGFRVLPLPPGATTSIRVFGRPSGNQLDSDTLAATYFRLAYGLSTEADELRWVVAAERPIVAGEAAHGGFIFCSADGKLFGVESQTGTVEMLGQFPEPIAACAVSADSFLFSAKGEHNASFAEQLDRALLLGDPQMAAAQGFLLEHLAHNPDPQLTKTLIDVISDARATPALVQRARVLLSERRSGPEFMLEALKKEYDFLSGVLEGPPVGPLAIALAALDQGQAAAPLARHLNDPTHAAEDLLQIALALRKLATQQQLEELQTFFRLYRATADSEALASAVVAIAETLLRVGGDQASLGVQRAASDPMTSPKVQPRLQAMFGS